MNNKGEGRIRYRERERERDATLGMHTSDGWADQPQANNDVVVVLL